MFRNIIFSVLRFTLFPFLIREIIQKKRITIVYCHSPSRQKFERQIKILKSIYNIISLDDFIEAKQEGQVSKLPPKSLIITLDDGHKSNYDLKSVLENHNIPVTIFLCSGLTDTKRHFWFRHRTKEIYNIQELKRTSDDKRLNFLKTLGYEDKKVFDEEQALSKEEIEEMKCVVDFQSHTMFHPILPRCSNEKSYREIAQSKKDLSIKYNLNIYALSYPNGDYSEREIKFAKRCGYVCALTCDPGFNTQYTDNFRLKRLSLSEEANVSEIIVRASGLWGYIKKVSKSYSHGYIDIS